MWVLEDLHLRKTWIHSYWLKWISIGSTEVVDPWWRWTSSYDDWKLEGDKSKQREEMLHRNRNRCAQGLETSPSYTNISYNYVTHTALLLSSYRYDVTKAPPSKLFRLDCSQTDDAKYRKTRSSLMMIWKGVSGWLLLHGTYLPIHISSLLSSLHQREIGYVSS